jgi:hypothetical protein
MHHLFRGRSIPPIENDVPLGPERPAGSRRHYVAAVSALVLGLALFLPSGPLAGAATGS